MTTWINPTRADGTDDLDRLIDLAAFTDFAVVGGHDPPLPEPKSETEAKAQRDRPFDLFDVVGYLPAVGYPKGGNEVVVFAGVTQHERARSLLLSIGDHLNGAGQ